MLSRPIPDKLFRNLRLARHVTYVRRNVRRRRQLTPAMYESLKLIAAGRSDPYIAAVLGISTAEAKDRTKRLLAYFDVRNRTELAVLCYRQRIV